MNKRFLLIANPIAGGGRGRIAAPRLQDGLAALGCDAELFFTSKSGDAAARAAQIAAGEYTGVIAVGGDGTLNEIVGGLEDPTVPLGILAMGTANVMAAELGLPRKPDELAQVLARGRTRNAAIGLVDGRRFLLFVSSGLDARVIERVDEVRTGTQGMLKYVPPLLHVTRRWQVKPLSFTTGDGERHENLSTVIVTRLRGYAGVLKFPDSIDLGDGQLHVLGFLQHSRFQDLRAFLRGMAGRLRPGRDLIYTTAREVLIESADTPWQVDGELGGIGSVAISLDPREARLFVP